MALALGLCVCISCIQEQSIHFLTFHRVLPGLSLPSNTTGPTYPFTALDLTMPLIGTDVGFRGADRVCSSCAKMQNDRREIPALRMAGSSTQKMGSVPPFGEKAEYSKGGDRFIYYLPPGINQAPPLHPW